jgi:hypothetical protein
MLNLSLIILKFYSENIFRNWNSVNSIDTQLYFSNNLRISCTNITAIWQRDMLPCVLVDI